MKIYFIEENAFVDIGKGYMICIGTRAEVEGKSDGTLFEMIRQAFAYYQFRSIESSPDNPN